ncbi:MAG TPA: alanine--glyoxylate aminotransferase family protein [Bacillota bacterium]|nr:alanine--glyoxylate aminotransferase family protein [Bacillota bacterium]
MLTEQQLLRIPGPSPIPPSVQRAMSQPMVGHRNEETEQLLERIQPNLKKVFGTKQDVAIIAGSGTAGLETAVVNLVEPGDEVLVIVTGSFGDRFAQICDTYGTKVHRMDIEWGKAASPEQVKQYMEENPNIRAVYSTYCETSTGILNPIPQLAKAVHETSEALFVVDGVSCVGAVETKMDEWGIDVLVTGSQKAFMLPPGLTFVAASERAWKTIKENKHPRFYLDLNKYQSKIVDNSTPFTPALSLLFGLDQVLQLFVEEGLENVYERHQLMMKMTRAAFKALDIPLLTTDESASPTVTSIQPNDFEADELRKVLKDDFELVLAGGQKQLKGKIFRVGHLGFCFPADVLQYISLIEIGLQKIGKSIELGQGTRAAQEVYLSQTE